MGAFDFLDVPCWFRRSSWLGFPEFFQARKPLQPQHMSFRAIDRQDNRELGDQIAL